MKLSQHKDDKLAAEWGEYLAGLVSQNFGEELHSVLQAMNIRLAILPQDQPGFPLTRFAVWEGDGRTIRLFQRQLLQKFSDWPFAARRACAHELFHALAVDRYQSLPSVTLPPRLSLRAQEVAAEAFAEVVARNFRLTLDSHVLNFD
jgi:hypothetical protein